ncbi:MAG: ATP-binding protein [Gemmatimonadota bacterium]|nr:ATP-binding protein [Gemmatimonadota bacterium]
MSDPATSLSFTEPTRSGGPPVPGSLEETGISRETITELALKTLYVQGSLTGRELSEYLRLPFVLLDEILERIQQRHLVEVGGTRGHGRVGYVFDLTGAGRERARESMESGRYVGPIPVPVERYREWVGRQSVKNVHVRRPDIESGFEGLVLNQKLLDQIGPAVNSAKSMFLYGESGNGKTAIAEAISRLIGGSLYLPYAVQIEGQVIVVHDPVYHRSVERDTEGTEEGWLGRPPDHDPRFVLAERPAVFVGGELMLNELDLQYDPRTKFYQAPFQMKANGGVLIIDDLGRQLVSPRDLLNRWIVPLEKEVDYLTLHTGHRFPVPFDCLVVFATNLDPRELMDEAFLRRIHYKIHVKDPSLDTYRRIFRQCCENREIEPRKGVVRRIFRRYYERLGIAPRSCHPRDLVSHLCDIAKYFEEETRLSEDLIDKACDSYFLDMPELALDGALEPDTRDA